MTNTGTAVALAVVTVMVTVMFTVVFCMRAFMITVIVVESLGFMSIGFIRAGLTAFGFVGG